MDYGATNSSGRTPALVVGQILDAARRFGVELIDTASGYGDSEQVLAEVLDDDLDYNIVTKTPDWRGKPPEDAGRQVVAATERSLRNLKRDSVHGLLVHNAEDLVSERGDDIWLSLESMRAKGLTRNIGVSVYTSKQIDHVLHRWAPDIIQLPLNVFDQRLVRSGHVAELHSRHVKVIARSIFLQGLLLVGPDQIPIKMNGLRDCLVNFHQLVQDVGLSPLQAALAYVRDLPGVDVVVVGVTTAAEFEAVATAFEEPIGANLDWSSMAVEDETLVDPRNW